MCTGNLATVLRMLEFGEWLLETTVAGVDVRRVGALWAFLGLLRGKKAWLNGTDAKETPVPGDDVIDGRHID